MALRMGMLRNAFGSPACNVGLRRLTHIAALRAPLDGSIDHALAPPRFVLPEDGRVSENKDGDVGFGHPSFSFGGSMELMAVPKRKVSPHKRGIRNGPKALKPTPVIVRCKSCGRVKLPHFYCCSGDRGQGGERSGATG